jgi:hypothetical protein
VRLCGRRVVHGEAELPQRLLDGRVVEHQHRIGVLLIGRRTLVGRVEERLLQEQQRLARAALRGERQQERPVLGDHDVAGSGPRTDAARDLTHDLRGQSTLGDPRLVRAGGRFGDGQQEGHGYGSMDSS